MWVLWIAVGLVVGWQFPQPSWAASLQKKATDWIANKLTFTSR